MSKMDSQKTLYIGAHADDVVINAAITIRRNIGTAYILTITDGVPYGTYPKVFKGIILNSREAYIRQRLKEDESAMQTLGINVGRRYTNGKIPDGETYQNVKQIVSIIATIVRREKIQRIMTHSFPGESHPAHPDHEIVSVCSYIIGKQFGIEIWEYPRFKSNSTNKQTDKIFLPEEKMEIVRYDFGREEIAVRDELMRIYITQRFILRKYRATCEMFGKVVRDPRMIPNTPHFYGSGDYKPGRQAIKKAIADFFNTG